MVMHIRRVILNLPSNKASRLKAEWYFLNTSCERVGMECHEFSLHTELLSVQDSRQNPFQEARSLQINTFFHN